MGHDNTTSITQRRCTFRNLPYRRAKLAAQAHIYEGLLQDVLENRENAQCDNSSKPAPSVKASAEAKPAVKLVHSMRLSSLEQLAEVAACAPLIPEYLLAECTMYRELNTGYCAGYEPVVVIELIS